MILPSKKVLSVFIVAAALVAAIIITFGRDKSSSAINFASDLIAGEKISIPENPDWQNELSGVSANTNLAQMQNATTTPETLTDTVSKSLISNYLAMKQSGTLDSASAQKLLDQTVNLFDELGDETILETKLNVIADNGSKSITDYGENLGNILRNDKPTTLMDERKLITDAISSRNQSKLDELDGIIAVYENISEDLIKMPVPRTFVRAHLDMINGVRAMAIALKQIKNVFNDPVKSLSEMQLYQGGIAMFIGARQATNSFIIKNNIVYKQGSGGYYLLYGI